MHALLAALVLSALSPARSPDAPAIAAAIAQAVLEDSERAPVTGSHAEDAALLAVIALEESAAQLEPAPHSWDARAGRACGAFQLRCDGLPVTLAGQARKALWLLHRGAEICPESPGAPYLGACRTGLGRRKADARAAKARAALQRFLRG